MRILMFSIYFPPQYSGAAKQALSLGKELRSRGHSIEFVTVRWDGLASHEEIDGFPVHRLEMGTGERHREFRLWYNFLRLVLSRRNDFDILHSHGAYYTNSIVGPLARLAGWKSIVKASLADNDLHGIGGSLSGRIHRAFLFLVDGYVAISKDLEREFSVAGLPSSRIHAVPNGVDTARFRPATTEERHALRRELGLPPAQPVALSVGVFDQRKNIGWLMEEWLGRGAFGTDGLLLAIGPRSRDDADGSFIGRLRQLASENPQRLRVLDHVEEIERYYRCADMFVLPSHGEGMPNVILEAMASGLPCVATRVSGTVDLILEGKTGFMFSPGNAEELGSAVALLAASPPGAIGSNARLFIESTYSLKAVAARYEAMYHSLWKR